jgi:hypothetical protein
VTVTVTVTAWSSPGCAEPLVADDSPGVKGMRPSAGPLTPGESSA